MPETSRQTLGSRYQISNPIPQVPPLLKHHIHLLGSLLTQPFTTTPMHWLAGLLTNVSSNSRTHARHWLQHCTAVRFACDLPEVAHECFFPHTEEIRRSQYHSVKVKHICISLQPDVTGSTLHIFQKEACIPHPTQLKQHLRSYHGNI